MVLVLRKNGMVRMKWLASKELSLACFILNCIFAYSAYIAGDLTWFIFSALLGAICFYNYKNSSANE